MQTGFPIKTGVECIGTQSPAPEPARTFHMKLEGMVNPESWRDGVFSPYDSDGRFDRDVHRSTGFAAVPQRHDHADFERHHKRDDVRRSDFHDGGLGRWLRW